MCERYREAGSWESGEGHIAAKKTAAGRRNRFPGSEVGVGVGSETSLVIFKLNEGKGTVHHRTGHEGAEGE
jgi:hypothetical protein